MADEEDREDSGEVEEEGEDDEEDDEDDVEHLEVGVLGEQSLQSAQSCLLQRNYRRAFAHYLLVLRLQPERRSEIKENFVLALREWAEQLEQAGRLEDMFSCYQQACELFPDCETMLNNMGAHLFRLGFIDEAASYFWRALKIDPDFLGARQNLENVCSHLVERWHFRMLNDRKRNMAYQEAIHRAVEHGCDSMLDIGSGTGLLSMFAAQTGACVVFACEMSKTMYEMSCDIVGANQLTDEVFLLHKRSNDLIIPNDLPRRVSLVVTETFDAGLLGEHVLSTLQHAWQHLLVQEGENKGRVIPGGATVYISAVESTAIRKQNRFLYPGIRHLDLSEVTLQSKVTASSCSSHRPLPISYQDLGEGEEDLEPYTTERLSSLPGGYKLLTKPHILARIDLNDIEDINRCLKGWEETTNLVVCKPGKVDALTLWFDLHMDDETTLVCGPETESCWEQAVYPVHTDHLKDMPLSGKEDNLYVRSGDKLDVRCECRNNAFYLQCVQISRQKDLKRQQLAATAAQSCMTDCSHPTMDIYGFEADSAGVLALNNNPLFDCANQSTSWSLSDSPPLLRADTANGNVPQETSPCVGQHWLPNAPCSCGSLSFGTVMERGQVLPPQASLPTPLIYPSLVDLQQMAISCSWTKPSSSTPSDSRHTQPTYNSWSSYNLQRPANAHPPPPASISMNLNYVHSIPAGSQTAGSVAKSLLFTSSVDRDGIWSHSPTVANGDGTDCPNGNSDSPPMWTIPNPQYASAFTPVTTAVIDGVCSPSSKSSPLMGARPPHFPATRSAPYLRPLDEVSQQENCDKTKDYIQKKAETIKSCFLLEGAELERLNDLDLNLAYCSVLECIIQQQVGVFSTVRVLDITQGASLLPLQALKMGAAEVGMVTQEPINQQMLLHLASVNQLQPGHIHFERRGFEEMESGWSVLITELVEPCGCLRQQVLEDIALARVTCLMPDAVVVPCSVRVCGMLIDSPSLHKDSAVVSDENTLGFLVSAFMNDFQMTTHVDIELSTLEYTKLSDPFELFTFDFTERPSGAVPTYLNQSASLQITATDIGQVTAVLYWFELQLGSGWRVCTLDQNLHWRQAAVMQRGPVCVSTGTPVIVRAVCQNSCISAVVNLPPTF